MSTTPNVSFGARVAAAAAEAREESSVANARSRKRQRDREQAAFEAALVAEEEALALEAKDALALEAKDEELKRTRTSVSVATKNLVCGISQELLIDPVTAEDGFLYEEREIKEWMRKKQVDGAVLRSPKTNAVIGNKLLPAIQVRNAITDLVDNGVVEGELGKKWRKAMDDKQMVEKTRKMAEGGDVNAMLYLGRCSRGGKMGVTKSDEDAYTWIKRAADLNETRAMAIAGMFLARGVGAEKSIGHGVLLTTSAAERGSDYACDNLGDWYLHGTHGLPIDMKKAMYWYGRVADGSCSVQQLKKKDLEKSKAKLTNLETQMKTKATLPEIEGKTLTARPYVPEP